MREKEGCVVAVVVAVERREGVLSINPMEIEEDY